MTKRRRSPDCSLGKMLGGIQEDFELYIAARNLPARLKAEVEARMKLYDEACLAEIANEESDIEMARRLR